MSCCDKCKQPETEVFHRLACPIQCLEEGFHDKVGDDVLLLTVDPVHRFRVSAKIGRKSIGLSRSKAAEILHHGEVHGKPLTDRQRRFMAWVAHGKRVGGQQKAAEVVVFNEQLAVLKNEDYRRVANTTGDQQLVLMSIRPSDGGVHRETHESTTQTLRIFNGKGSVEVGNTVVQLEPGVVVIIPPGQPHEVFQRGEEPLKLSSVYVPPEHPDGLVQTRNPDTAK